MNWCKTNSETFFRNCVRESRSWLPYESLVLNFSKLALQKLLWNLTKLLKYSHCLRKWNIPKSLPQCFIVSIHILFNFCFFSNFCIYRHSFTYAKAIALNTLKSLKWCKQRKVQKVELKKNSYLVRKYGKYGYFSTVLFLLWRAYNKILIQDIFAEVAESSKFLKLSCHHAKWIWRSSKIPETWETGRFGGKGSKFRKIRVSLKICRRSIKFSIWHELYPFSTLFSIFYCRKLIPFWRILNINFIQASMIPQFFIFAALSLFSSLSTPFLEMHLLLHAFHIFPIEASHRQARMWNC